MAQINYRTINIDAYDPESAANFDLTTLTPGVQPVSTTDVQSNAQQIRQMLRGGDGEGALRSLVETPPYGADAAGKEIYSTLAIEILQSIRQNEMTPIVQKIYTSDGGIEQLDVLMKYLYKGMSISNSSSSTTGSRNMTPQATGFSQIASRGPAEGGGQTMSVLLSWHEKLVEIAGPGSIVRVMSDRRTV